MLSQQNYEEKLLILELSYAEDFDSYLPTYLTAIRLVKDKKYDILTHKN